MKASVSWLGMLSLCLVACGDETDSNANVEASTGSAIGQGGSSTGTVTEAETDAGVGGSETGGSGDSADSTGATPGSCGETPERLLIFGDSLFGCFGQGSEKSDPGCSALIAHGYLDGTYAPGVTYENNAINGARTADLVQSQLPAASVGQPGHTLVVIWVGGNDISDLLLVSDQDAEAQFRDELTPRLDGLWSDVLAWVDNPANFPDGATLVVNTQFNPFDDCTADPYTFMSPLKTSLLSAYNERMKERVADRANTYVTDHFPAFLGHGHHYANAGCANFVDGNEYWMLGGSDLIHPNTAGHAAIAETLQATFDEIYGCE